MLIMAGYRTWASVKARRKTEKAMMVEVHFSVRCDYVARLEYSELAELARDENITIPSRAELRAAEHPLACQVTSHAALADVLNEEATEVDNGPVEITDLGTYSE